MKRVKAFDAESGRIKDRNVVSKEALDATEAARALLSCGDVASFGIAPGAWAAIAALPDFFPKAKKFNAMMGEGRCRFRLNWKSA
jgi:hypothetical protein